jgi:carboxymethylenebutenolidase
MKIKNGDLGGKGEVIMVFGKQDTHVDREGRSLIRDTLDKANVPFTVGLSVTSNHAG